MRFVLNKDQGGFGLSQKALELYNQKSEKKVEYAGSIERTDPVLIEIVKTLGDEANTKYSVLRIVEIPDNSFYEIVDYDGVETIYYSQSEILSE